MAPTKKGKGKGGKVSASSSSSSMLSPSEIERLRLIEEEARNNPRTVTCVLGSHPLSRDVQLDNFSLQFYGHDLIVDSRVELNYGRRYGLIGPNGSGKSTLLAALGKREAPIPQHIDIFYLDSEIEATDKSALEAVIEDVEKERVRLEAEAEHIMNEDEAGAESTLLHDSK